MEGRPDVEHYQAEDQASFHEERRQGDLPLWIAGAKGGQLKDTPQPIEIRSVPQYLQFSRDCKETSDGLNAPLHVNFVLLVNAYNVEKTHLLVSAGDVGG